MVGFLYKSEWSSMFLTKKSFYMEGFLQQVNVYTILFFCIYIFPILAVLRRTFNYIETNFHKILEV